jgi:hypothetical protein
VWRSGTPSQRAQYLKDVSEDPAGSIKNLKVTCGFGLNTNVPVIMEAECHDIDAFKKLLGGTGRYSAPMGDIKMRGTILQVTQDGEGLLAPPNEKNFPKFEVTVMGDTSREGMHKIAVDIGKNKNRTTVQRRSDEVESGAPLHLGVIGVLQIKKETGMMGPMYKFQIIVEAPAKDVNLERMSHKITHNQTRGQSGRHIESYWKCDRWRCGACYRGFVVTYGERIALSYSDHNPKDKEQCARQRSRIMTQTHK